MAVKQVITIHTDLFDSTHTDFKIVETPEPIALDDHALLSYIFKTDTTDESIEIEIELLEEVTEAYSHDMTTTFLFVEKKDGQYYFHEKTIAISEITTENLQSLMKFPAPIFKNLPIFRMTDGESDDFALIIDKANIDHLINDCERADPNVIALAEELNLGTNSIRQNRFRKEDGNHVTVKVYVYPELNMVIEHNQKSIFFDPDNLLQRYENLVQVFDKTGNCVKEITFESDNS